MHRLVSLFCVVAIAGCPVDRDVVDAGPREGEEGEGEGEEGEGEEGEGEDVDAGFFEGVLRQERSLVWTDPAIVDNKDIVGLGVVFGAAATRLGTTPGALFHSWLLRFSSTAHSERAGPARLAQQLRTQLGDDPAQWDVDDGPFKVTAVHNRIDLFSQEAGHCGELRVSLASTDELVRPFHVLFLFRQPAGVGDVDVSNGGERVTCAATADRWARLSAKDGADFAGDAAALLAEGLTADRFLLAESVELTVSPWEWRQWVPAGDHLENPPLFQQVNPGLTGDVRDEFIAFVDENAAALDARRLLIPERFRGQSVRVTQGIPWQPLDLIGVSAATATAFPQLRQKLEIVGCAACHTADAEFVQTREDRTFSRFYTEELKARRVFLDDLLHGVVNAPPFGPLQPTPVLPP